MEFVRPGRFKRAYRNLSPQDQQRFQRALCLFAQDPLHPSLRVEKVLNPPAFWSFRVTGSIRCTFIFHGTLEELPHAQVIELSNLGGHEVYKNP